MTNFPDNITMNPTSEDTVILGERGREIAAGKAKRLMSEGPFAFPFNMQDGKGGEFGCPGMTLRDYFAAKALCAITVLDRVPGDPKEDDYFASIASYAYSVADAMMKARG